MIYHHVLSNITENIRKALGVGNIGWNFFRFTKSFWYCRWAVTLSKLNHYGICGVSNDWFKCYLFHCSQYVSINESGLAAIDRGVPQGSVLGPLLFLLYVNNLNQVIKFCKVYLFSGDTNLSCLSNSIKN